MPSSPLPLADRSLDPRLKRLIERPFAHRGLHREGRIENSRAAFAAAIDAGMGIELDVQATSDGAAMVFHDSELDRLAEGTGSLAGRTAGELGRIRLRGSDETISRLEEILELVGGRVPLLIELKAPRGRASPLCAAVREALVGYDGPIAPMSFNPDVGDWFARRAPEQLRGLVVTENGRRWRGMAARYFALWRARPHFLAYDIRDLPSTFAQRQRERGLAILTWTCRSDADRARAALHADQVIHEYAA